MDILTSHGLKLQSSEDMLIRRSCVHANMMSTLEYLARGWSRKKGVRNILLRADPERRELAPSLASKGFG